MKAGKVSRLSPNEEAAVLKQRLGEKRRTRLLQVREQERGLARKMCKNVQARKENEQKALDEQIEALLAKESQQELRQLESLYNSRVRQMGKGHRDAYRISQDDHKTGELKLLLEAEQKERAQARHEMAMKELSLNQRNETAKRDQVMKSKKKALEIEKERSRQVATRAYSSDQPLILNFEAQKGQRIQFDEADSYASSYYHLPHTVVEREPVTSFSAHQTAKDWQETQEEFSKHSANAKTEQDEKAWLRHKYALARVRLERDREDMMSQLEVLEKEDRAYRQRTVGGIPTNVFQPIHQRIEMVTEQQKDMEQTFERLLLQANRRVEPFASGIASSLTAGGEDDTTSGSKGKLESPKASDPAGPPRPPSSPPVSRPVDSRNANPKSDGHSKDERHSLVTTSSRRMQTEPLSVQFPRMQVQGLLRPSLSMVDTTSTADSSTREDSDYKRDSKASLKTASKPPKQPVEKIPSESMQRLITMVKEQQEAWKERQAKLGNMSRLSRLEPGRSRVVPGQIKAVHSGDGTAMSTGVTEPSDYDKSEDGPRKPSKTEEDASISMYPIILQDSDIDLQVSRQPSFSPSKMTSKVAITDERRDHILSPPSFSVYNTGLSPDPLSITQYHTTLDASSAREHSGSPDLFSRNYPKHGLFGHHSPKSLSITPYNTTLDNSMSTLPPSSSCNTPDLDHHLTEKAVSAEADGQVLSFGDSGGQSLDECGSDIHPQSTQVDYSVLTGGQVYGDLSGMVAMSGSDHSTPHHNGDGLSSNSAQNTISAGNYNSAYDESCQDRSGVSFYGPPRIGQNFNSLYFRPNLPPLLAPSLDETSSTLADQFQTEETHDEYSMVTHSDSLPIQLPTCSAESFHLPYSSTSSKSISHPQSSSVWHPLQSFQSSNYSPVTKGIGGSAVKEQMRTPTNQMMEDRRLGHQSSSLIPEEQMQPTHLSLGSERSSLSPDSPESDDGSSQGSVYTTPCKPPHHIDTLHLEASTPPNGIPPASNLDSLTTASNTLENQNFPRTLQSSALFSLPGHYNGGEIGMHEQFQSPLLLESSAGPEQTTVTPSSRSLGASQSMDSMQSHLESGHTDRKSGKSTILDNASGRPHMSSTNNSISIASYQTVEEQSRTALSSDLSWLEFPGITLSYPTLARTPEKPNLLRSKSSENHDLSIHSSVNPDYSTAGSEERESAQLLIRSNDELTDVSQLSLESNHDQNEAMAGEDKWSLDERNGFESHEVLSQEQRHGVNETDGSLQAAFLRKKAEFVKQSQIRMKNLKFNALQRQQPLQTKTQVKIPTSKPRGHTKTKIGDTESSKSTKGVKFSESPMFYYDTGMHHLEFDIITREKDMIKRREMKKRNLKLYNKLDEVKQKREEEERIKRYADNRKKAKDYHQRLRTKSKILRKDSSTATVQARKLF